MSTDRYMKINSFSLIHKDIRNRRFNVKLSLSSTFYIFFGKFATLSFKDHICEGILLVRSYIKYQRQAELDCINLKICVCF
jgi:hypothetical protein